MRHLICFVLLAGCGQGAGLETRLKSDPVRHRPQPTECSSERAAAGCSLSGFECSSDSECTAGSNGRCYGNSHDGCSCSYDECFRDADCGTGKLCDCRDLWHYGENGPNRCMPGNCITDADCGAGGFCSPSFDPTCGPYLGVTGWYCHTKNDECNNDSDCPADGGFGWGAPYCTYRPEVGRWTCAQGGCVG